MALQVGCLLLQSFDKVLLGSTVCESFDVARGVAVHAGVVAACVRVKRKLTRTSAEA